MAEWMYDNNWPTDKRTDQISSNTNSGILMINLRLLMNVLLIDKSWLSDIFDCWKLMDWVYTPRHPRVNRRFLIWCAIYKIELVRVNKTIFSLQAFYKVGVNCAIIWRFLIFASREHASTFTHDVMEFVRLAPSYSPCMKYSFLTHNPWLTHNLWLMDANWLTH